MDETKVSLKWIGQPGQYRNGYPSADGEATETEAAELVASGLYARIDVVASAAAEPAPSTSRRGKSADPPQAAEPATEPAAQ